MHGAYAFDRVEETQAKIEAGYASIWVYYVQAFAHYVVARTQSVMISTKISCAGPRIRGPNTQISV